MTNYEIMFILNPDLGEEKTKEEIAEMRTLITSQDGKILNEDIHGLREFAYRIKKFDKGYYVVFNFSMPSEKVKSMEQTLNIHAPVLRYLVMKEPKNYIFKTLAEFDKEAEKEAKKIAEEKKTGDKPERKPVKPPVVKKEAPKPPKKEDPKEQAEVEKKLESIIDDPDITL